MVKKEGRLVVKEFPNKESIHTVVFDFDGVFTDNKVWVDQEGRESVRCDRSDGLAFDFLRYFKKRGLGIDFFILSKETNPVVLNRARKLKVDCHHGVNDKLSFMQDYLAAKFPLLGDVFEGLVYLGNDLNDMPVMLKAGYSISPADAHPMVLEVADLVMPQKGGEGFVRAFVERLLGIHNLSKEKVYELISNC